MRAGEKLGGRYRLDRELGRGGFGVVFEAYDELVTRPVAVKVISEQHATDEREVQRFISEARTVGGLSHPNIVTLHDLGQVAEEGGTTHYLVMELVRGRPLSAVLLDGVPDQADSLEWLRQVCGALEAAHRAGVAHRDVKPENIMITEDGDAKVLDFGISRLMTQPYGYTDTGGVIGSPPYLAPERWSGSRGDARADLYALGVVLYQLCTGRRPFEGPSLYEFLTQHVEDAPVPPRTTDPALAALVLQLLAKNPDERPADAGEVRRRLRDIRPDPSPAELRRRADLAWEHGRDGRFGQAVTELSELIPLLAAVCGPADPRTLRSCHDLALWLARDGRPGAAVALLRQLVDRLAAGSGAHAAAVRDLARWEREPAREPEPAGAPSLAGLLGRV